MFLTKCDKNIDTVLKKFKKNKLQNDELVAKVDIEV